MAIEIFLIQDVQSVTNVSIERCNIYIIAAKKISRSILGLVVNSSLVFTNFTFLLY